MAKLDIMTPKEGHQSYTWADRDTEEENKEAVAEAEKQFNLYRNHRLTYKTDKNGQNPEQITKFDSEAENITMALPMVGG